MSLGLKIRRKGDVYHLVGRLDGTGDLSNLSAENSLKLNLSKISSVNSLGAAHFIGLIKEFDSNGIEYHEVPLAFLDFINTFPQALGRSYNPNIVRSLFLPFSCGPCGSDELCLVEMEQIKFKSKRVPGFNCPRCSNDMELDGDFEDLLIFYYEGY